MSGTSMATPHVAGAAAIVKQAHPSWTGQQLKAALVSSANSAVPGDVRAQGGGRLDVIAAVEQAVTTTPVQGGTFAWPHTSAQIRTINVPYTNVSAEPVSLRLSVAGVTGDDGSAVRSAPVTLGDSTVTVPAHQTVNVPLRVNPTAKLEAAQYGDVTGRIVATGDAKVSTPFSLYITPETVQLTVRMKDRMGNPASAGSSVDVVNIDSIKAERAFNDGAAEQTFNVRPGTYFLSGFVTTPDPSYLNPNTLGSIAYFARPELKVTGNVTVDFDATRAHLVSVKTERPSEAKASVFTFSRTWDDTWIHSGSIAGGLSMSALYADVQGNPHQGTWEFGTWSRRYAPNVESMSVVGGSALHPIAPASSALGLDGVGNSPLVDGGDGSTTELTPDRVGGKVALVKVSTAGVSPSMVTRARDAGAKALLAYAPAPGKWIPTAGFAPLNLATYAIPMAEGEQLKALLAGAPGGERTLAWKATARSPYVYNLGFPVDPADRRQDLRRAGQEAGPNRCRIQGRGRRHPAPGLRLRRPRQRGRLRCLRLRGRQRGDQAHGVLHGRRHEVVPLPHVELPLRRGDGRRLAQLPGRERPQRQLVRRHHRPGSHQERPGRRAADRRASGWPHGLRPADVGRRLRARGQPGQLR
jgi:hypothetical protein